MAVRGGERMGLTRGVKRVLLMVCAGLCMAPWPVAVAQDQFNNNTRGGRQEECRHEDERDGWECVGDPYSARQTGELSWCHVNPGFVGPEGPNNHPIVCLPPGEQPPYLRGGGGGGDPEGPYLGRRPPIGDIPRRGPGAYPRGRVTCQANNQLRTPTAEEWAHMNRDPYWCPDLSKPPLAESGPGAGESTAPPTGAGKPGALRYPKVLGRPGWIPSRGGGVRAYRFADGHVYEFASTLSIGVLQGSPPPRLLRNGKLIDAVATYGNRNGFMTGQGKYVQ
jgi:hypothetical protein